MRRALNMIAVTALTLSIPALVLASGGGGAEAHEATPWLDVVLKTVNFAVLIGILYWALKGMIPQALKDRRDGIATELKEAKQAKVDAEGKLADYQQRVANLEAEIAKLKDDFKAEGEVQKKRILEEATQAVATIHKNAEAAGARETKRATEELRGEAVKLALETAEQILAKAYGAEDQKKALEQTIEKIEGLH